MQYCIIVNICNDVFWRKKIVFNLDHVVDNQRETRPDVDSSVKYFFFMKERSVFMYKFCKYIFN